MATRVSILPLVALVGACASGTGRAPAPASPVLPAPAVFAPALDFNEQLSGGTIDGVRHGSCMEHANRKVIMELLDRSTAMITVYRMGDGFGAMVVERNWLDGTRKTAAYNPTGGFADLYDSRGVRRRVLDRDAPWLRTLGERVLAMECG